MSLSKCQRLASCCCEWSYCLKTSLGDTMHFIHFSSIFDDRDIGRIMIPPCSDLPLSTLLLNVICIPWLEKDLWHSLCLLKIDQSELPGWNISIVAIASHKGILSRICLLYLWETSVHTSCNLTRSWKALSFMKWGSGTVREATAAVSLFLLCSGFTGVLLSLTRGMLVQKVSFCQSRNRNSY